MNFRSSTGRRGWIKLSLHGEATGWGMARWTILGVAATSALAAAPAAAQYVPLSDETRLREALTEAKQARDAAAEALSKADEAIAILERALTVRPAPISPPASATQLMRPDPKHPPLIRPSDMPACDVRDRYGLIGDYMLKMAHDGRQKKESSFDATEIGADRGINAFVYHCLGLTRATQYEAITNLSVQFTGTKGNDQAEMAITRTARAVKTAKAYDPELKDYVPGLTATFNRYRVGGFGRTGSNGEASLIDLTTSNFASGVGLVAGFEWGRSRPEPISVLRSTIHGGIAKARQECFAANNIVDPLKTATSDGRPHIALDALAMCEGNEFVKWLSNSKRANQYWSDIVAPLWGNKKEREIFAGIEARYAFQDISYLPIIDPATGAVIVTSLPDAVNIHPEPYSVKVYGGFNREFGPEDRRTAMIGLTGSLTYRREIDFLGNTSGKTVCSPSAPGATFDICNTDMKLAAPYDTSGFVGGVALDLRFRRFWQLPPIATSPRLTYAFDTNRLGVEVPLYLLTDSDGKLNSGVKYVCRFRGTTPEGFELKKTCSVSLFVGTSFEIGKTP